ncbi:MAG TPA: HEPN domain-containing protein [Stellaceae bacterium]|nr:HEPN domain-containing protein [Stellaceae bacterium]
MTPQAAGFMEKARKLLTDAEIMLHAKLSDAAGRNVYLACFHAAQAFIFERVGKTFKSHNGVQTEFLRLTKGDPRIPGDLRTFLSRSYNLKSVADYETGRRAQKFLMNAPAMRLQAASDVTRDLAHEIPRRTCVLAKERRFLTDCFAGSHRRSWHNGDGGRAPI